MNEDAPGPPFLGKRQRGKCRCAVAVLVIRFWHFSIPIASIYGIFTYIWLIFMANVGKYTIHGSYGILFHTFPLSTAFPILFPSRPSGVHIITGSFLGSPSLSCASNDLYHGHTCSHCNRGKHQVFKMFSSGVFFTYEPP